MADLVMRETPNVRRQTYSASKARSDVKRDFVPRSDWIAPTIAGKLSPMWVTGRRSAPTRPTATSRPAGTSRKTFRARESRLRTARSRLIEPSIAGVGYERPE
jgi:hypothetical protein